MKLGLVEIQVARKLRKGIGREALVSETRMDLRNIEKIESSFQSVPDMLLARIERLLYERDKLRHAISSLMQGT